MVRLLGFFIEWLPSFDFVFDLDLFADLGFPQSLKILQDVRETAFLNNVRTFRDI